MKVGTTELLVGGVLLWLLLRNRNTPVKAAPMPNTANPSTTTAAATQRAQKINGAPTPEILCYHAEV